ncbi:MAG: aminopeptidase P family protein [Chloroflexi bacterium]|nr:MAG: aminopeptidase P family protein [Chloroflexota bacterium]
MIEHPTKSGDFAGTPLLRLRAWIGEQGADAAYVSDPVSIAYLTGFYTDPHERLMGLGITEGRALLIVPGLERESAEAGARGVEVLSWRDGEDPYELVREAIGRPQQLAVEKGHLTVAVAERLGAGRLVDAGEALRRFRLLKSAEELERLGRAAAVTDTVTGQIVEAMHPGQTEIEVGMVLASLMGAEGAKPAFESIVQSGPNSAQPHLRPTGRRLQAGDLVLLDFGAAWEGYRADTTRMAVVGEPDQRQRELHQLVLDAHDAAVARVKPGVTTGEVDAAAREVIERGGQGAYFIHRIGHGLGLEVHEDPSLDPGSQLPLEEGMVFTIEPGVYIPGWGGIRIEDDVVVERDGARMLTGAERGLRVVPA